MQSIAALTWQPQADVGAPLAPYTIDPSVDQQWSFNLQGTYNQLPLTARGVYVDNSGNSNSWTFTCGPLVVAINGYESKNIDFPGSPASCGFTSIGNSGQLIAQFYVKAPAPQAQGSNVVGAQVFANQNLKVNEQVFTAVGASQFTATFSGPHEIVLTGGGGGGGYSPNGVAGSGGGAGETGISIISLVAGTTYNLVIGGAGALGSVGVQPTNGGDSTIVIGAITYRAHGGAGGLNGGALQLPGTGGNGGNFATSLRGGDGGYAQLISGQYIGGLGGASYWGAPGHPGDGTNAPVTGTYGTGGPAGGTSGAPQNGANGGSGYGRIRWWSSS